MRGVYISVRANIVNIWAYILYIYAYMSSARPRARTPNPAPCARRRKLMAAVRFRAAIEAQSIAYTPTNSARRADWARGRTGECLDGGGDEQERERGGPEERHYTVLRGGRSLRERAQSPDLSQAQRKEPKETQKRSIFI